MAGEQGFWRGCACGAVESAVSGATASSGASRSRGRGGVEAALSRHVQPSACPPFYARSPTLYVCVPADKGKSAGISSPLDETVAAHNVCVKYGLGIPLPEDCAQRIEAFRAKSAVWAIRPMRSEPHISIKGPAGLSEDPDLLETVARIAHETKRFSIRLTDPTMFDDEPILYLGIDSEGWWQMQRALVESIAELTGAEMHPWEIAGWIPHTTLVRVKPELRNRRDEIPASAAEALSPLPVFDAEVLRMYQQDAPEERWSRAQDFSIGVQGYGLAYLRILRSGRAGEWMRYHDSKRINAFADNSLW